MVFNTNLLSYKGEIWKKLINFAHYKHGVNNKAKSLILRI